MNVLPHLVASAVAGVLVYLSFPPFDLGFLAFLAFVPMLVAVGRTRSYLAAAACGAVTGLVGCLRSFAWVASVAVAGWLALAGYVGLYFVAAAVVIRWLQRHSRPFWPLLAAMLWVALELVRAGLGPGFPWLFLGYTQYRFGGLLQTAAMGGVYAVGFVVFLVGAALAAVVGSLLPGSGRRGAPWPELAMLAGATVLLVGCAWGGGMVRDRVVLRDGPVVGVVQQNIPRIVSEIFDAGKTAEDYYGEREREVQLCAQLTARLRGRGVRLVVWPESTVPVPLDLPPELFAVERERRLFVQAMDYLRGLGQDMGCHFLIGAPAYVSRRAAPSLLYGVAATEEFGNSAVFLAADGRVLDRYDKMRLVPFGEYVPWRDVLPWLAALTPIPREITPGREEVVFELPDSGGAVRFGALVCYEDVFPDLCASFRRRGAQSLVNVTDEGWYTIAGELWQHLAMAVFRAVETRTTIVRAANTGVSCFIDPRGEVYAMLEPWTQGALSAPLRLCDATTPYARFGDAFAIGCLMLVIVLPSLGLSLRGRDPGAS